MKNLVVIINGKGGVGKDSFVNFCITCLQRVYIPCANLSSVDKVKQAAYILGWDGIKDDKGRKFLSDLKDLSSLHYDGPLNYIKDIVDSHKGIIFCHVREPKEIQKINNLFNCVNVLIKSNRVKESFGNHADDNVDNFDYDHVIENNDDLIHLEQSAFQFSKLLFLKYQGLS